MREKLPITKRCKTRTWSAYPHEYNAVMRIKAALKIHAPFDVVRFLVQQAASHPLVAKELKNFRDPRISPDVVRKEKAKAEAAELA